MDRRLLTILVVLFAAVAGFYLYLHRPAPPTKVESLYTPLTPKLTEKGVTSVAVWTGTEEKGSQSGVRLRRKDGVWQVERREQGSTFWVRAKEAKVERFIQALSGLKGEFRSDSKELLSQFHIADDQGLHIVVQGESGALAHLVVGKKGARWDTCYVRKEGSPKVYLVEQNLLSLLDIWSQWPTGQPSPRVWTDLQVIRGLPREVVAISYARGDTTWSLTRGDQGKEKGKGRGEGANSTAKAAPRWVFSMNGKEVKKGEKEVKGFLDQLLPLEAKDVYPPDQLQGTGLGPGEEYGRLTLHFDQKGIEIYHIGHKNDKGDKGWVRDSSGEVYLVDGSWIDLVTHPFQPKQERAKKGGGNATAPSPAPSGAGRQEGGSHNATTPGGNATSGGGAR